MALRHGISTVKMANGMQQYNSLQRQLSGSPGTPLMAVSELTIYLAQLAGRMLTMMVISKLMDKFHYKWDYRQASKTLK